MRPICAALALVSIMLAAPGGTPRCHAQASGPRGNPDSVRAVVARYLHGLKFNDTASFQKAFWPEALLLFVGRDGNLDRLTQSAWYRMFASSAGKEEQG